MCRSHLYKRVNGSRIRMRLALNAPDASVAVQFVGRGGSEAIERRGPEQSVPEGPEGRVLEGAIECSKEQSGY
jgi:hypothetical protein